MDDSRRPAGGNPPEQTNPQLRPPMDGRQDSQDSTAPNNPGDGGDGAPQVLTESELAELEAAAEHRLARTCAQEEIERTFPNVRTGSTFIETRANRTRQIVESDAVADCEFWTFKTNANRHGCF